MATDTYMKTLSCHIQNFKFFYYNKFKNLMKLKNKSILSVVNSNDTL